MNKKFDSVDHHIIQHDEKTFIIRVSTGSKFMYSFLEYFIDDFRSWMEEEKRVIVKGNWDKFDSY